MTQVRKEDCDNKNRKGICFYVNKPCKVLTKDYTKYCLFYKGEKLNHE